MPQRLAGEARRTPGEFRRPVHSSLSVDRLAIRRPLDEGHALDPRYIAAEAVELLLRAIAAAVGGG